MVLFYERINWENYPSMNTAISALNLNKIDLAVKTLDERTVQLNTTKAEQATVLNTVQDWSLDESTGIITITKVNGEKISFDLNIEKIPVNFELSENGILSMTTDDGTMFTADIGSMIPIITFESSDTVYVEKLLGKKTIGTDVEYNSNLEYEFAEPYNGNLYITPSSYASGTIGVFYDVELHSLDETTYSETVYVQEQKIIPCTNIEKIVVTNNGSAKLTIAINDLKNATYKFEIPDGAITEQKLNPNYLADLKLQAETATQSATSASASATQAGESATRAYDEAERAKLYADTVQEGITTTTDRTLTESHAGGLIINSMDGESQQNQYSGKNLLENTGTTTKTQGITFTVNEDKSITAKGTATGSAYFNVGSFVPTANESYVFGSGVDWDTKKQCFITKVDGKDDWLGPRTFTPTTNTEILCTIYIASGETVNLTFKPMIRLASITDATTYEPYVGGQASPNPDYPQEIKSVVVSEIEERNKNWISADDFTLSAGTNTHAFKALELNNKLKPNTQYTVSFYTDFKQKITALFTNNSWGQNTGAFMYVSPSVNGRWICSFITPADVTNYSYLLIYAGTQGSTVGNTIKVWDIQIEEGSIATDYEPFRAHIILLSNPITLRGIGDVKDVLCKRDGVYGVVRNFGSVVFNGSESWTRNKANSSDRYYYILTLNKGQAIIGLDDAPIGYCSHFEKATRRNSYVYATDNRYCVYDTYFTISYNTTTSLEEFKAWLASNNVTIDFKLATPTFEPLPIADQIALRQLETFDTVTYISTDSEIEPIMEVEYGTSKVGAYAIKGMNTADANALKIEQLNTLTNELATQLVAGSEV